MRVVLCVDALQPQLSGIGRYTWELCKGLTGHREISNLEFYRSHSLISDPERLVRKGRPAWHRRQLSRLTRSRVRRALRASLVHGPNYFLPLEADTGVITVHDLSTFRYPESHPTDRVAAFERLFASSVSRASHVITDTETVRRELIEQWSVAPGNVSSIPLGVGSEFHQMEAEEVAGTLAVWHLTPGQYGLSVAAFEPRKKIAELICAWERLPRQVRNAYPLVLAGVRGWQNDNLLNLIKRGASEGWLKHIGFVNERDLPHLYAGARLFVYPSIYEGFGLPPIEAMASGVPVVVSNRSCLPEVCGNAARFIDPDDLEALTDAIHASLLDEQWRSMAVGAGLKRARLLTWDGCVRDTVAVYKKVWGKVASRTS